MFNPTLMQHMPLGRSMQKIINRAPEINKNPFGQKILRILARTGFIPQTYPNQPQAMLKSDTREITARVRSSKPVTILPPVISNSRSPVAESQPVHTVNNELSSLSTAALEQKLLSCKLIDHAERTRIHRELSWREIADRLTPESRAMLTEYKRLDNDPRYSGRRAAYAKKNKKELNIAFAEFDRLQGA